MCIYVCGGMRAWMHVCVCVCVCGESVAVGVYNVRSESPSLIDELFVVIAIVGTVVVFWLYNRMRGL